MTTFFTIIGIIVLVVILFQLSLAGFFFFMNSFGNYNIGGVPNTWKDGTGVLLYWAVVGTAWYFLTINLPFHVSFTG